VIGPTDVNVAEGVNTIVYAWGSLEDDNLTVAVQTIGGLHSAPGGVPAGEAGLVATNAPGTANAFWIAAAALGALGAAVIGSSAHLRRRTAASEKADH
jgi:hypothetical protein